MPIFRFAHVRLLLKEGKAKVVKQKPFTIQLLYDTPEITQPHFGGTDPGRTNIGGAVLDAKGRIVYEAQVETRNRKTPKLMQERAQHRRASRMGERKRRQRRAKAHGTEMQPNVQQKTIAGCKEPITLHGIRNSEARFRNRKRPAGWLTPTARQLIQTHLNMVKKILSILPVTN